MQTQRLRKFLEVVREFEKYEEEEEENIFKLDSFFNSLVQIYYKHFLFWVNYFESGIRRRSGSINIVPFLFSNVGAGSGVTEKLVTSFK